MKKIYVLVLILLLIIALAANMFAQTPAGSLPVVLVGFSADLTTSKAVAISWTTQQEVNTDCFNVEKSNDGSSWLCISTIKANGNSARPLTYHFLDAFPLKGSNFYRIQIKDLNGNYGYTIIKNARMNLLGRTAIYPNPSSKLINISLGEIAHADWNLLLINSFGQVVVQRKYNRNTTLVSLAVGNYPNGNYTMEITDGSSKQSNTLMINHN
ncbi:MAG TPA: T9SS type A sorting domain-containing protein [Chitinophagaceae bacterium]|nr:T9SS type A sorting domain-containing protein [Chitinophagaceae bacterium]